MSNETRPQSIDISSILSPLIEFAVVYVMMRVMMKMFPSAIAPNASYVPATKQAEISSKYVPSELVENPDWSNRWYTYQQTELESLAKSMENRSLGVKIEAAGDICRELLGHQYNPSGAYILEKLTLIDRETGTTKHKDKLSVQDDSLQTRAINGYANLEFVSRLGVQAKALVMTIIRQDNLNIGPLVRSMKVQMLEDKRFTVK